MAAKLSRYVFRRIGGRIVPIRVGAKKSSKGGFSSKMFRKVKTMLTNKELSLSKAGKFKKKTQLSGTDYMNAFIKKTGAARVSVSDDFMIIDVETALTSMQRSKLFKLGKGKEIFHNTGSSYNFNEAIRQAIKNKPKTPNTETAKKIIDKSLKRYPTGGADSATGYVLPSGKRLDFSSGHSGYGVRDIDHRDVSDLVDLPRSKNIPKKDLNRELRYAQGDRKSKARKKDVGRFLNSIKNLQKSDTIKGAERGKMIKANIDSIPKGKLHKLKKLKKKK